MQLGTLAAAAPTVLSGCFPSSTENVDSPNSTAREEKLRFFVVSDAHFGWKGQRQPDPEEQRRCMALIMQRFPNLDFFIDSGDGHHNNADDTARAQWVEIIANGCGRLPFFFVAGNHEVDVWKYGDPEMRSNALASVSARPYYSFDIKNIHFLVLPQLMYMSYLTREALDWAYLDLAANHDKTTIVLSHNSIVSTTSAGNNATYRQLWNSDAALALLDSHPDVQAWMHGHNHSYEIVPKHDRLYVSNGRFGGFVPRRVDGEYDIFHRNAIGGFYVEITPESLNVRAYDLSNDQYFDVHPDQTHLSQSLGRKTTLDSSQPPAISYGVGRSPAGSRLPILLHHTTGRDGREVMVSLPDDFAINEGSQLEIYAELDRPKVFERFLAGFEVHAPSATSTNRRNPAEKSLSWQWQDGELVIGGEGYKKQIINCRAPGIGRTLCYYHVVPGRQYVARITINAGPGGQYVNISPSLWDEHDERIHTFEFHRRQLQPGQRELLHRIVIPNSFADDTIYSNINSNRRIQMDVRVSFENCENPVRVKQFIIEDASSVMNRTDQITDVKLIVNNTAVTAYPGQLSNQLQPTRLNACERTREVIENETRCSWLFRDFNPGWQVRNALCKGVGQTLEVGPIRNLLSPRKEVIIVPFQPIINPYIHRLRMIDHAVIQLWDQPSQSLSITPRWDHESVDGNPEVELVQFDATVKSIDGADTWSESGDVVTIRPTKSGKAIIVKFD